MPDVVAAAAAALAAATAAPAAVATAAAPAAAAVVQRRHLLAAHQKTKDLPHVSTIPHPRASPTNASQDSKDSHKVDVGVLRPLAHGSGGRLDRWQVPFVKIGQALAKATRVGLHKTG